MNRKSKLGQEMLVARDLGRDNAAMAIDQAKDYGGKGAAIDAFLTNLHDTFEEYGWKGRNDLWAAAEEEFEHEIARHK